MLVFWTGHAENADRPCGSSLLDTDSTDWRGAGLMQLLKRASRRRGSSFPSSNSTESSQLAPAGSGMPPCFRHLAYILSVLAIPGVFSSQLCLKLGHRDAAGGHFEHIKIHENILPQPFPYSFNVPHKRTDQVSFLDPTFNLAVNGYFDLQVHRGRGMGSSGTVSLV